jgi:hypothetical protein
MEQDLSQVEVPQFCAHGWVLSGGPLLGRQLSLIRLSECREKVRGLNRTCVTEECDKAVGSRQ